jgi:hypothetical protein
MWSRAQATISAWVGGGAGAGHHEGGSDFPRRSSATPTTADLGDVGMGQQEVLDLGRVGVEARRTMNRSFLRSVMRR